MANNVPSTPNRKTRLRFDTPDQVLLSSVAGGIVTFDKASQQQRSSSIGCKLIPNIGWQLAPQQTDLSAVHELYSSQVQILKSTTDGGTLQVASGVKSKNGWRWPTELVGTAPVSGDVATSSDYVLYRTAPSGTLLKNVNLNADQASYPDVVANDLTYNQPLCRVVADTVMQDGTKPFMFRFTTPSSYLGTPDILYILYFAGPASYPALGGGLLNNRIGTGNFGLVIRGNGTYDLYEKFNVVSTSDTVWVNVHSGQYQSTGQVTNTVHRMLIFPYTPKTSVRSGAAGGIAFLMTSGDAAGSRTQSLVQYFKGTTDPGTDLYEAAFKGKIGTNPPTTTHTAIRLSQRQDLRSEFQLSMLSYTTRGLVVVDPFIVPTCINPSQNFIVQVFGVFPSGSSVTASLFDATKYAQGDPSILSNTGIVATSTSSFAAGLQFTFNPYVTSNIGSNSYYIRLVLNGTTTVTPTITQVRYIVNGIISNSSNSEFDINYPASLTEVNISGPGSDPSHETASTTVADLGAQYKTLGIRGEFPVIIDTEYSGVDWTNSSNNGKQSVLFDGYSIQEPSHRVGSDMPQGIGNSTKAQFPAPNWSTFKGNMLGKWKRLNEVVAPFNWDFAIDPTASTINTPPFAVDVIAELLSWAGMPSHMIDIGPGTQSSSTVYPIRLFPKGQDEGIILTAGANIFEFIRGIARDYLGSALIWNANATADTSWSGDYTAIQGCWQLIKPTPIAGPYNTLVNFTTTSGSGIGSAFAVNCLEAYPSTTGNAVNGSQIVQTCPIFKDTLDTYVVPPEANRVVVTGTGELNNGYQKVADQLTCFIVNANSYNINNIYSGSTLTALASGSDWIGRERTEYYVDTIGINTPQAAQWVNRRIFDLTAHAIRFVNFVAPLVLVQDLSDHALKRPRPLRFYDAITIDGQPYLIRNVSPFYTTDFHQLARYEISSIVPASAPVVPQ